MFLFPIWAAGAMLYYKRPTVSRLTAYFLLTLSIVGYAFIYKIGLKYMAQNWLAQVTHGEYYHLGLSTSFPSDFCVAGFVVANFIAVDNLTRELRVPQLIRRGASYAASFTLAVYLFHLPVAILLSTVLHVSPTVTMTLIFPLLFVLGVVTEHQRMHWRAGMESVIQWFRKEKQQKAPDVEALGR